MTDDQAPTSSSELPDDPFQRCLLDIAIRDESEWSAAIERACDEHPEWRERLVAKIADLGALQRLLSSGLPAGMPSHIGPYQIEQQIGAGGMGTVWRARHQELRRPVALKLIRFERSDSASAGMRFQREALSASKIDHPVICPVYEAGQADGFAYIAMRLLEGETLADRIARSRPAEHSWTRSDLDTLLAHFERLAAGLEAAHERGLVHRDIKPANIFLTRQDEVVLLDFGLARDLESDDGSLTVTGDRPGTPEYMAPEQVRGATSEIDASTDVYALAVTLYQALCGKTPFHASGPLDRAELDRRILREEPPSLLTRRPELPRELWPVLEKALAKRRSERFGSAAAFAEQLRRIRCREPITVKSVGPLLRARRWTERNPVIATVLALLSTALTASIWFVLALTEAEALQTAEVDAAAAVQSAVDAPLDAIRRGLAALDRSPDSVVARRAIGTAYAHLHQVGQLECQRAVRLFYAAGTKPAVVTLHNNGALRRWQAGDERGVPFEGPANVRVRDVEVSPDGRTIVTGSEDGSLRGYAPATGALLWTAEPPFPQCTVFDVVITAAAGDDGFRIGAVFYGRDRRVTWQVRDERGELLHEGPPVLQLPFGRFPPSCAFLDPDHLLCNSSAHVRIWELSSGDVTPVELATPTEMAAPKKRDVSLRAPATGAGYIVLYGTNGYAALHTNDGRLVRLLGGHRPGREIRIAAVSPDGRYAVTAGHDQRVVLHDLTSGGRSQLNPHRTPVLCVTFAPSSKLVLTGDTQGVMRVFDVDGRLRHELRGHGAAIRDAVFVDAEEVLSTALDDTLRRFTLAPIDGEVFSGHADAIDCHTTTVDGTRLVTGGADALLIAHDMNSGIETQRLDLHDPVEFLASHPTRPGLVAAAAGSRLQLIDVDRGVAGAAIRVRGPQSDLLYRHLAWTEDGAALYATEWRNSGKESRVRRFELDGEGHLRESDWQQELPRCHAFAMHPRGHAYVVGCYDGVIRRFGLDGAPLAGVADLETGVPLTEVGCSPDGQWLYGLSRVSGPEVWLWRWAGGAPTVLDDHRLNARTAAFSPDSRRLATGGVDGSLLLYACDSGWLLREVDSFDGIIQQVTWPAGLTPIVTSSSGGTTRLWHPDFMQLVAAARNALRRNATLFDR